MLQRRTQSIRKGSRRTLASLGTSMQVITSSQTFGSAVVEFFTALPHRELGEFAIQLQAVPTDSQRTQLLTRLREEVAAGLWGVPDLQLPTVLSLLKQDPHHLGLHQVVHSLATLLPTAEIEELLLHSPETLLWWEDLAHVLPDNPYFSYTLPYVRGLREAISTKTLTIGHCLRLRQLSTCQLAAFLRLLRIEQVNEEESVMAQCLSKAFAYLDQVGLQLERIQSVLNIYGTQTDHLKWALESTTAFVLAVLDCPLKDFALPADLQGIWELADKPLLLVWLSRLLASTDTSSVLPVTLSHLCTDTHGFQSEEEFAYCQREILRLSFPQLLLHIHLSQEPGPEKERLIGIWYKHHILSFTEFLQETFYEDKAALVAVLTRDLRDTQLPLRIEHIREKAYSFQSAEQLYTSLEAFLHSPSQRLYVLDYFLDDPPSLSLETCKRALEEANQLPKLTKLLCLLVRLPRHFPALSTPWPRPWKLASMESLSEAFSPSLERLHVWLKQDTGDCLDNTDFTQSDTRVEAVLTAVYPTLSSDDLAEIRDLSRNADFCRIIGERLRIEEKATLSDWKLPSLSDSQESFLQGAVENFLTTQAAVLLRPILTTTKSLQAFPSFLQAVENSPQRRLWRKTFLQLLPEPVAASTVVNLNYPFVLKDYKAFVAPAVYPPQGLLTNFNKASIAANHQKADPAAITLLDIYIHDLAILDLAETPYEWQGKRLFEHFCAGSVTFEEAVGCYTDQRDLILFLCKAPSSPLLNCYFDHLLGTFPGQRLTISKKDLLRELIDCQEDLNFQLNPCSRLFSVDRAFLLTFSCLHKRVSRSSLTAAIAAKHSSLLLVPSTLLFCCGGRESSWQEDTYSAKTWTIALPNVVTRQADMFTKRSYHGLALCAGQVYAIGGASDLTNLRSCEKYMLDSGQWSKLGQEMAASRCYFNPVVYQSMIYLLGGSAPQTEVVDSLTDFITCLPLFLPGLGACISVLTGSGVLIVSEAQVWEVELETLQSRTKPGPALFLWSTYPPVCWGREVLTVDRDCTFRWLSGAGECKGTAK